MKDEERSFLETHFKTGEYGTVTVMVKLVDMDKFLEHLKRSGLNMVAIPSAKAKLDFEMSTIGGKDL